MKAHTLSREEEALLSLTMDLDSTPQSIFYMFNNADIQFESVTDKDGHEVGISHGRFVPLLESPTEICAVRSFSLITIPLTSIRIP